MPFRTPNDLSYSKLNLEDFDEQIYHPQGRRDNTIKRFGVGLVSICLLILILLSYVIYSLSQAQISSLSDYGALFKNSLPRSGHGIRRYKFFEDGYDDEDFAKGDPFWASDYPVGSGVVYLTQDHIKSLGLHSSVISPFRDGNVSAYESAAYHSMHCLATLRYYLWMFKTANTSKPYIASEHGWKHVRHCLADLRQYILCNFDENLLYVTDALYHPGGDQPKKCKTINSINHWLEQNYIPKE